MNKKVLILFGHYDLKGNNGQTLDAIISVLKAKDFDYEVTNPFVFFRNMIAQHPENGLHQDDAKSELYDWYRDFRIESNQAMNEEERLKIQTADLLIAVFPVWWFSPPGPINIYLSEVFRSASFKVENGEPKGNWSHIQDSLVMTHSGFSQDTDESLVKSMLPNVEMSNDLANRLKSLPILSAFTYAGIPCSKVHNFYNTQRGQLNENIDEAKNIVTEFLAPHLPKVLTFDYSRLRSGEKFPSRQAIQQSQTEPRSLTLPFKGRS